jgi:anti-anti-sigma regulatory factor
MPTMLTFPTKADVSCVAGLREEWLSDLDAQHPVQIDCSGLETMSAAAAQLVLSLAKTMQAHGGSVKLTKVGEALREDFVLLGLQEFI